MVQKSSEPGTTTKRGRGRPRGFDADVALERAGNLFWSKGYAATSLDDLAAATGLNRPSLYAAFGDKQALYLAALERFRAVSVGGLQAVLSMDEPLRDGLERVFAIAAKLYLRGDEGQRGCFLVSTAVTEALSDKKTRDTLDLALKEQDAAFRQRFMRAQDAGALGPGADIQFLAQLATTTLNGMAIRARAGGDAEALAELSRGYVNLVCGPTKS